MPSFGIHVIKCHGRWWHGGTVNTFRITGGMRALERTLHPTTYASGGDNSPDDNCGPWPAAMSLQCEACDPDFGAVSNAAPMRTKPCHGSVLHLCATHAHSWSTVLFGVLPASQCAAARRCMAADGTAPADAMLMKFFVVAQQYCGP